MKIFRCWDRGKNRVAFVQRSEESGRLGISEEKFEWFFYILKTDFEDRKAFFKQLESNCLVNKYEHGDIYTKVYVDKEHSSDSLSKDMEFIWEYKNRNLNRILEMLTDREIPHFEADVPLWKRWLVSRPDIEMDMNLKVLYLDIETDDEKSHGQPTPGEFQILSISFVDGQTGKEAWICCNKRNDSESEKEMLIKAVKIINGYDVLVAFNGIAFDFAYIRSRMALHGLSLDWRKKFLQDLMVVFKKSGQQLQSYSLEFISQHILGRGKVKHEKRIFQMFDSEKNLLNEYNLEDSRLMYEIEKKTKYLEAQRGINRLGLCPCDDPYISRKIDNLVLKQAFERDHYHFKTPVREEENAFDNDDQFEGAFVLEPVVGLHANVHCIDFSALYVNIIRTFNISPDTVLESQTENCISNPSGNYFMKDIKGIFPIIVESLMNERDKYTKLMKTVEVGSVEYDTYERLAYCYKSFVLSFYGVMGLKTSRFYDVRIAESVTLGGKFFTKNIIEYLRKLGYMPVAADTDSALFRCPSKDKIPILLSNIKKICEHYALKKFNCNFCSLEMSDDKSFKTFLIIAKKRYAGIMDSAKGKLLETPKLSVTGLESKRTDVCNFTKRKQMEFLTMVLRDEPPSYREVTKFIEEMKMEVMNKKLTLEDITFGQKLTKNISDYKAATMNIKVAQEMIDDEEEVYVGDKILYFIEYCDQYGKPVPVPVYKFKGIYDVVYYWDKKIYPAFRRILEVIFPQHNWEIKALNGRNRKFTKIGRMDNW